MHEDWTENFAPTCGVAIVSAALSTRADFFLANAATQFNIRPLKSPHMRTYCSHNLFSVTVHATGGSPMPLVSR